MGSNKEAQAARNTADRRLREAYPEEYAALMHEEHAARGLKWSRRATAEERARRDAEAKQRAAKARILRDAEKAGIDVFFGDGQDDTAEGARLDAEAPVGGDFIKDGIPTRPPHNAAEEAAAWGDESDVDYRH